MGSSRALVGTDSNGNNPTVRTDSIGNIGMVDWIAQKVNDGKLFYVFEKVTIGVLRKYLFRVGATPIGMMLNVTAGLATPIDFTEGVTVSATGSALIVTNYNRTSANTLALTAFQGPTFSGGTVRLSVQAGFGTALAPVSGSSLSASALPSAFHILSPNTDYTLSYTPVASIDVMLHAVFWDAT